MIGFGNNLALLDIVRLTICPDVFEQIFLIAQLLVVLEVVVHE